MAYQGPRKCSCGCKRPAVLFVLAWDLAFATACAEKYQEANRQLEASLERRLRNADAQG